MNISIIVAIANNMAIGKDNDLIWHISEDLKRFKSITSGNTIIMGRKTYESIGRPLPKRRNIVISRNKDLNIEGVEIVNSLDEALRISETDGEVFIIGGGAIYKEAMPLANKLYLTKVNITPEADVYFPDINYNEWRETYRRESKQDDIEYAFVDLERIK
ncbi:MAG: dihydrofolate reductase [Bacteroidales bacterium]|nr:dihydrofolate reductase [Bacteroidales bacterium]